MRQTRKPSNFLGLHALDSAVCKMAVCRILMHQIFRCAQSTYPFRAIIKCAHLQLQWK